MRLILAGVLALPMFAQGPFTEAVTAAYERVKLNLVETAVAMPEEHYEFRLSPQQRPFSEWLTHTAMGNYSFCAAIRGTQAPSDTHTADAAKGKAEISAALKASFDYCDAALKEASDQKTPARPMISLIASLNEHYGNLVGYLRAKGIVPPSSARASKKK